MPVIVSMPVIAAVQWVFGWRLQAEQRMRAAGKPGMTDAQIADFVSRYMPAYTAYLPGLYAQGPTTARAGHTLMIEVDQSRAPVPLQPKTLALNASK
jgi:D-glycerate 3-kinase